MTSTHDSDLPPPPRFVSRGGIKLHHALRAFALDPRGLTCADLGCNVGGFTDCLLQAGAAHVYSVDTAYGQLAWTLRKDPRVTVVERTNALHTPPHVIPHGGVDLVVVDLGWTPQKLAIPAALAWLRRSPDSRIISLIKPHYELSNEEARALPRGGVLDPALAQDVVDRVVQRVHAYGVVVLGLTRSPITGGGSKNNPAGNTEWLVALGVDSSR